MISLLPRISHRNRGVALVVVLAFVVLLTVMVVAFLSRSLSERQVSASSASITRTETFGLGALDVLSGLLKQEIVDGSDPITSGGKTFYRPKSADGMRPSFSGVTVSGPANLLKVSAGGAPFYTGAGVAAGPTLASGVLTTDSSSSQSGRAISLARWNKALLLPKQNPASADLTPVASFPAPTWVYVSRDGSFPTTWNAGLINNPGNSGAVVGRFAYAIYDEGGVLDANVAGYPASISASGAEVRGKGATAWVDLADIGLNGAAVANLISWRNAATGASASDFFNAVTKNQRGFLTVNVLGSAADRVFASRQQLIQFLDPNGTDTAVQDALQYLGTFSREVAAPSWAPPTSPISTNLDVFAPTARVTADSTISSYYADGSAYSYKLKAGDPITARRFNLHRIAWLGRAGPQNGGNDANIQACFGLKWNGSADRWDYVGPNGNLIQPFIATLSQVAQARREPNFFEMLKAAILSGSLGITCEPVNQVSGNQWPLPDARPYNRTAKSYNGGAATYSMQDSQIIQLGLNLIDQYDSDSYPTRLAFGNYFDFAGIEALPYIYRVTLTPYRPKTNYGNEGLGDSNQRIYATWYEPVLWSPAKLASTAPPPDEPPRFRFTSVHDAYANLTPAPPSGSGIPSNIACVRTNPNANNRLIFSKGSAVPLGDATANPILMRDLVNSGALSISPERPEMDFNADGTRYVGFWAGQVALPTGYDINAVNFGMPGSSTSPAAMFLEADYNGTWRVIQSWRYGWTGGLYVARFPSDDRYRKPDRRAYTIGLMDPRTSRFGVQDFNFTSEQPFNSVNGKAYTNYWPTAGIQLATNWNPIDANFNPSIKAARESFRYGANVGAPSYFDPDGTQRRADGSWDSAASNTLPMRPESDYRPVQLNRAFRSVGEMGYAFRDLPFRSIDLSTSSSADGGLLDFFSVSDADADTGLTAGKVNLNTRQTRVLSALLKGVAQRESPATNLSSADADAIALALATQTKAPSSATGGPLVGRSDLATKFGANSVFTSIPAFKIKTQRESAIRSLAEAGQTRTWNLMIDLIAQVGRFAPGSTSLNNFTVEGERRFWLHLAIDRFTGEVVDRQLEIVQE